MKVKSTPSLRPKTWSLTKIRYRDIYINAQMKNTKDQKKEHQISRLVDEKIDLQISWGTAENLDQ